MYWYYLVLKKTELDIEPDYQYYLGAMWCVIPKPIIGYFTFEYDSKNILHCNYIFARMRKLDFTKIKIKGCHLHFEKIGNKWDMFNIMKYIHKDYVLKSIITQICE